MSDSNNSKSNWIWVSDWDVEDNDEPKFVYFRKTLTLPKVTAAKVHVSADSRYRLYINGVSVSFGPCKGDGHVWYYEELDIAPYNFNLYKYHLMFK